MLLGCVRRLRRLRVTQLSACELCGLQNRALPPAAATHFHTDGSAAAQTSPPRARYLHRWRTSRCALHSATVPLLQPPVVPLTPQSSRLKSTGLESRDERQQITVESRDELRPVAMTTAQRLVAACPESVQPYLQLMRVDRPIGSWLLFWPCGWGLAQGAPAGCLPDPSLLAIYAAGAFIMRGAGCTINDMWDRDIDRKVERTRSRPLTSGRVSTLDAMTFLSGQMSVGCLLLLQLNWPSILLGVSSLSLVVLYPLMKRITHWPQLVLGLTLNWGVLMAFASTQSAGLWSTALPLYAAGFCWTIVYDTIYAHQDKKDDLVLGMKSTALRFGDGTPRWLAGFSAAMMACLVTAGISAQQTWPFYLGLGAVGLHLANQVTTLNIDNASDCGDKFRSNRYIGLILFLSIAAGRWLGTAELDDAEAGVPAGGGDQAASSAASAAVRADGGACGAAVLGGAASPSSASAAVSTVSPISVRRSVSVLRENT